MPEEPMSEEEEQEEVENSTMLIIEEEVLIASNDILERGQQNLQVNLREIVRNFRSAADETDHMFWNHTLARAGGSFSGVMGGALFLSAGIATSITGGLAAPLFFAGTVFGVVGSGTLIGASIAEAIKTSKVLKKADNDLKRAATKIQNAIKDMQGYSGEEDGSILCHIFDRLWGLFLKYGSSATKISAAPLALATGKALDESSKESFSDALKQASKEYSDDMIKVFGRDMSRETLSRMFICLGAVVVVWDVIRLGISLKDVILKKESEAAKILRQRADQLENILNDI